MQATSKLALRTREVFNLFKRTINGDRLFIDAILHKFKIVMSQHEHQTPNRLMAFNEIKQAMITLTQQFSDEVSRFEQILAKRKALNDKKINFIEQFHPSIIVSNTLCLYLIEFIEMYDKLVALIKLLHLAECFTSDNDYYANLQRIQTVANKMLSRVMLTPTTTARISTNE